MPFEVIESQVVFRGRVFKVRKDKVRVSESRVSHLDVVEHRNSVTIVPLDSDGNLWFVRQYRHPVGGNLLELPAGVIEPAESAEECAYREIREETGMAAGKLREIGSFFLAPGYSTEYMYVFLATELDPDPLDADEDEFISIEKIPVEKVLHMAKNGQIQDVKTIGSIFLAQPFLFQFNRA
jgi:8-oxo-dGTP pyrophosphatase MutT (NUDIX family)